MIIYIVNGIVEWLHEDITIKEQERFINDDNCIVIDKVVTYPPIPNDGYDYSFLWDEVQQEIVLVRGSKLEPTPEEVIKNTYSQVMMSSEDTLLNMELNTDTNTKVTLTGDDSLLLMEMLVTIDEKLTQLLSSKQV